MPSLVSREGVADVGNDVVSIGNDALGGGNDVVSFCDVATNVKNFHMRLYCEFGLKGDG